MQINSPWTTDQVSSLMSYQNTNKFHPFTGENSKGEKVDLIPTKSGWIAEPGGNIVQDWCHHWMADWSWKKL